VQVVDGFLLGQIEAGSSGRGNGVGGRHAGGR
jgi:hypothetical protein